VTRANVRARYDAEARSDDARGDAAERASVVETWLSAKTTWYIIDYTYVRQSTARLIARVF